MKLFNKLFSLGVLVLFISSCNKDLDTNNLKSSGTVASTTNNSIAGKWELRKVTGGFRGTAPEKEYLPGNGYIWVFSDSTYQSYLGGVVLQHGNYSTGRDSSNATGQLTDFILSSFYGKMYFQIRNDTLRLYRGELAYDGTISDYKKIP